MKRIINKMPLWFKQLVFYFHKTIYNKYYKCRINNICYKCEYYYICSEEEPGAACERKQFKDNNSI